MARPCTLVVPPEESQRQRAGEDFDDFRVGQCPPPQPQHLPVALDLPGWTCDEPADDKTACSGPDGGLVTIVVRPSDHYDAWVGDPDKEGEALWVSPLHDNYFVSVQGDLATTDLDDFVDALAFKKTWKR